MNWLWLIRRKERNEVKGKEGGKKGKRRKKGAWDEVGEDVLHLPTPIHKFASCLSYQK